MNIVLRVINQNVDLTSQQVLAYLKPQGQSENWVSSAWQACSPQSGGSARLKAITSDVEAYASYGEDANQTATISIPPQSMSVISQNGNVVGLSAPTKDTGELTPTQSGVKNSTTLTDVYIVWCVNGASVCRPQNPMMNTGISSFELTPKVYFTIGSQQRTQTFTVQNWVSFTTFNLPANLTSADITVSLDPATNAPVFNMSNQQYTQN